MKKRLLTRRIGHLVVGFLSLVGLVTSLGLAESGPEVSEVPPAAPPPKQFISPFSGVPLTEYSDSLYTNNLPVPPSFRPVLIVDPFSHTPLAYREKGSVTPSLPGETVAEMFPPPKVDLPPGASVRQIRPKPVPVPAALESAPFFFASETLELVTYDFPPGSVLPRR